jgi:hypothetical protein
MAPVNAFGVWELLPTKPAGEVVEHRNEKREHTAKRQPNITNFAFMAFSFTFVSRANPDVRSQCH